MIQLLDDNGNQLPKETQDRVNSFIDNLKNIPWFKPSKDLKKEEVEKQIKFTLECFGVKAEIEFRKLQTEKDFASAWDSAWDSAWASARASARDSAMASARASARDSARDSAWDSAWDSARDSAWDSAWDSARASAEILIEGIDCEFNKKYPNGAFKQLFKIWEIGLCPVGILEEAGTFVVYIPPCEQIFPNL